jgi:hypothetical protein
MVATTVSGQTCELSAIDSTLQAIINTDSVSGSLIRAVIISQVGTNLYYVGVVHK